MKIWLLLSTIHFILCAALGAYGSHVGDSALMLGSVFAWLFVAAVTYVVLSPIGRIISALDTLSSQGSAESLSPAIADLNDLVHSTNRLAGRLSAWKDHAQTILNGTQAEDNSAPHVERALLELKRIREEHGALSHVLNTTLKQTRVQRSQLKGSRGALDSVLGNSRKVAENLQTAFKVSERAQNTFRGIRDQFDDLETKNSRIAELVEEIRSVTQRLDLLSLNASLEANRAGESGKTFAQMAGEMRKLAEQIQDSISEIQESLVHARNLGKRGLEQAEEGRKLGETTSDSVLRTSTLAQQTQSHVDMCAHELMVLTESVEESARHARRGLGLLEGLPTTSVAQSSESSSLSEVSETNGLDSLSETSEVAEQRHRKTIVGLALSPVGLASSSEVAESTPPSMDGTKEETTREMTAEHLSSFEAAVDELERDMESKKS